MSQDDLSDPEYIVRHQDEFGRRLLHHVIDERARRNHPRPFASIPYTANPKDGYRDIGYRVLSDAVDRCAWWIKSQLGTSDRLEPLMYLGAFDLRYQILAFAAVKTGHVMFFPSSRNSLEAQLSLIDSAQVTKVLTSADTSIESLVMPMVKERQLQHLFVPELEELLDTSIAVDPFVFTGTFDEYRMKPWILLHTSGSTGFPKIIPIKHGYATSFDAYWISPHEKDLFVTVGQKRMFIPFPPFHMAGIVINGACALFLDATVVMLPVGVPLTAEVVSDICLNAKVEFVNLPPAVLMDMVKNPVYLQCLSGMKDIAYGGGPLPSETGKVLSEFANITSYYGSTEACIALSLTRPREYWNYFKFDTEYAGIEFHPVTNTANLYEFVFVRKPHLSLIQAVFVTFPDIDEYHTRDLFSQHPTEPDLWKYEGRLDDMIVLSNAEKFNPVAMEGTTSSCPAVKGALVVGTGRFQTALLVEIDSPAHLDQEKNREELLESIWPYIDTANRQCPTYARLSRDLIGFTKKDKPLIRAAKGTIQRVPSLQLYASAIEELYARADESRHQPSQDGPKSFDNVKDTEDFLHRWFHQKTRFGNIDADQDFFNNGMDSLDVVNLNRLIMSTGQNISTTLIYNNPTIKQLVIALSRVHGEPQNQINDDEEQIMKMQHLFLNYEFQATEPIRQVDNATNGHSDRASNMPKHVLLIGSTGR